MAPTLQLSNSFLLELEEVKGKPNLGTEPDHEWWGDQPWDGDGSQPEAKPWDPWEDGSQPNHNWDGSWDSNEESQQAELWNQELGSSQQGGSQTWHLDLEVWDGSQSWDDSQQWDLNRPWDGSQPWDDSHQGNLGQLWDGRDVGEEWGNPAYKPVGQQPAGATPDQPQKQNTIAAKLQSLSQPDWEAPPKKVKAAPKGVAKTKANPKPKASQTEKTPKKREPTAFLLAKKKFLEPFQYYNRKEQEKRQRFSFDTLLKGESSVFLFSGAVPAHLAGGGSRRNALTSLRVCLRAKSSAGGTSSI